MPLRRWISSANHAIEGILHAAKTQRHLRYHFYFAAAALTLSYVLGVTKAEFLIVALAVIAVLLAEMLNTSVEVLVDLIAPEKNDLARTAKDIAAGAVLITAFGAAVIGFYIMFPYIRDVFSDGFRMAKHTREEVSIMALILVLIVVVLLKSYFGKGHPLSGGFPSGHAALSFSVWVSVTYTTESFIASVLCFILAAMIAQSRISTKVHTPFEVVVGALIGAALTFAVFQAFA